MLGRELAAQRVDRLLEILAGLAAGNGVVGQILGKRERLFVGWRCAGMLGPLGYGDQGIGEIAPAIELFGANAELGLDDAQAPGDVVGSATPMRAMHGAMVFTVAAFHLAVLPGPRRLAFGGFAPGRGEESETGDAEHRHDQERDKFGGLHRMRP